MSMRIAQSPTPTPSQSVTPPSVPGATQAQTPSAQVPASPSPEQRREQLIGTDSFTPAQTRPASTVGTPVAPAATPPQGEVLGSLSRKYEAPRGPGTVSSGRGDLGGVSYGSYQFATNNGSAQRFVDSLKTTHPEYHQALSGHKPGTQAFSNAWKDLAARDPAGFDRAQHDYIQATHYEPATRSIQAAVPGLDVTTRSKALRDVVWSTAVQHGPGPSTRTAGADRIFQRALQGRDVSRMSDEDIIKAVYAERGRRNGNGNLVYFSGSSRAVQEGVAQRYKNEQQDALNMLREQQAATTPTP